MYDVVQDPMGGLIVMVKVAVPLAVVPDVNVPLNVKAMRTGGPPLLDMVKALPEIGSGMV